MLKTHFLTLIERASNLLYFWTDNPESPRSKSRPKIDNFMENEHTWRRICRMIHRWTSERTWCWSTASKPIEVIGILNIYPVTSACFKIAVTRRWTHIIFQFHVIDCYITLVTRTPYSFEYNLELRHWSDRHLSIHKVKNVSLIQIVLGLSRWVSDASGKKIHTDYSLA